LYSKELPLDLENFERDVRSRPVDFAFLATFSVFRHPVDENAICAVLGEDNGYHALNQPLIYEGDKIRDEDREERNDFILGIASGLVASKLLLKSTENLYTVPDKFKTLYKSWYRKSTSEQRWNVRINAARYYLNCLPILADSQNDSLLFEEIKYHLKIHSDQDSNIQHQIGETGTPISGSLLQSQDPKHSYNRFILNHGQYLIGKTFPGAERREIYVAYQISEGRAVAIKRLNLQRVMDKSAIEALKARFQREKEITTKTEMFRVASVYDYWEENTCLYQAIGLVRGEHRSKAILRFINMALMGLFLIIAIFGFDLNRLIGMVGVFWAAINIIAKYFAGKLVHIPDIEKQDLKTIIYKVSESWRMFIILMIGFVIFGYNVIRASPIIIIQQAAVTLRQGPSTQYNSLGTLAVGTRLEIEGIADCKDGSWYSVRMPDETTGWIKKSRVNYKIEGNEDNIGVQNTDCTAISATISFELTKTVEDATLSAQQAILAQTQIAVASTQTAAVATQSVANSANTQTAVANNQIAASETVVQATQMAQATLLTAPPPTSTETPQTPTITMTPTATPTPGSFAVPAPPGWLGWNLNGKIYYIQINPVSEVQFKDYFQSIGEDAASIGNTEYAYMNAKVPQALDYCAWAQQQRFPDMLRAATLSPGLPPENLWTAIYGQLTLEVREWLQDANGTTKIMSFDAQTKEYSSKLMNGETANLNFAFRCVFT
jgi:uncharacterized protein YraI